MGRLVRLSRPNRTWLRIAWPVIRQWGLPVILTLIILFGVHTRVRADPAPSTDELIAFLATHELEAYSQPEGQYQQAFFNYGDNHVQLSTSNYNHVSVSSSGQHVVWAGQVEGGSQIFLYDVLNKAMVQLTSYGTSQSPFVHGNTVTWEHWDGDNWQIYYFNGIDTIQITNDATSSVRASTDGSRVLYAHQLAVNSWQAIAYNVSDGQKTVIHEGDEASTAYPQFKPDGSIITGILDN